MQKNCRKLKLPFEVLIQGPSGNRFVRSLLNTTTDQINILQGGLGERPTRSTVSIYRPADHESSTEEIISTTMENNVAIETNSDIESSVIATLSKIEDDRQNDGDVVQKVGMEISTTESAKCW